MLILKSYVSKYLQVDCDIVLMPQYGKIEIIVYRKRMMGEECRRYVLVDGNNMATSTLSTYVGEGWGGLRKLKWCWGAALPHLAPITTIERLKFLCHQKSYTCTFELANSTEDILLPRQYWFEK